jgi:catechol 2,3-dioxygenase-like lactoylglutathione lyase family enzyme
MSISVSPTSGACGRSTTPSCGRSVFAGARKRTARWSISGSRSAYAQHRPNLTRLAFCAPTREEVDRIAAIAAAAGARAYEAPALCDEIAENYYAAFFEDPDGNRLEVVCR